MDLGLNQLSLLASFFFLAAVGCGQTKSVSEPPRWLEPVKPSVNISRAEGCWDTGDCLAQQLEVPDEAPIAKIILFYMTSGRDFGESIGPDGYVLRLVPLNKKSRPSQVDGEVVIGLFADSPKSYDISKSQPFICWRITEDILNQYWVRTSLLDGYLFRLDWGENKMKPGSYQLVVLLRYQHRGTEWSICRNVSFQDLRIRYSSQKDSG